MRIALRSACDVLRVAFVPQGRLVRAGEAHRGTRNDGPGRSDLVLPPCRPKWLWTKRTKDDAKLNTGDFSERRWNAAVKKIVSGEFSALTIFAEDPDSA